MTQAPTQELKESKTTELKDAWAAKLEASAGTAVESKTTELKVVAERHRWNTVQEHE